MSEITPREDFARYITAYVTEMAFGDEEPGTVLDRYHTPDIDWVTDGIHLDRDRLIAHATPARKNVTECAVEVHDTLVSGDRVAARYTLNAQLRKGNQSTTEIYLFGTLAPDGRLSRVDQITRTPQR
jgi:hypothetical protein